MDIVKTIEYLHPTLEFWPDFIVSNDSQWWPDIITWITTEYTEPTQPELDAGWIAYQAEQAKQADIKAFCDAYILVEKISYKLSSCNENINKVGCSQDNKDLIQMQIDDFEIKLIAAETARDTLISAWIANYTDWSDPQKEALVAEFNVALIWS